MAAAGFDSICSHALHRPAARSRPGSTIARPVRCSADSERRRHDKMLAANPPKPPPQTRIVLLICLPSIVEPLWCGRPGSNRHSSFEPRDFLTSYGFGRLAWARWRVRLVCGLDYTFTLALSRFRCCPSSLYTFAPVVRPERLARDCLLPVSPNLGSSAPSVSRRALKLFKSLASTSFATPAYRSHL